MSETVLVLMLSYVALATLVGIALIASRIRLPAKLILVLAVIALFFTSYRGWWSVQGWSTPAPLPERFLLHASVTQEPDKSTGAPGTIYIWASDLSSGRPAEQPRAYRVDYDKTLHTDLEEALRNMRNGIVQLGRVSHVTDQPERPTDLTRMGVRRSRIEIYALPDPALPEK